MEEAKNIWVPEPDDLVARLIIGTSIFRADLCYRVSPDNDLTFRCIASIVSGVAGPVSQTFVETTYTMISRTTKGFVYRFVAGKEMLTIFKHLWGNKNQLSWDDWFKKLLSSPDEEVPAPIKQTISSLI